MCDHAIDQAIFSMLFAAGGRWQKVAKVIGRVADSMSNDFPHGDEGYDVVARRIEALVGEGRLMAQGNIKNWRFSEIRLPTDRP